MISLVIGAAMLAGPTQSLLVSDPGAKRLSAACVKAVGEDVSNLPPRNSTLNAMTVRRMSSEWRVDYDVTLQDRMGRSERWVGACTVAAPKVTLARN